MPAPARVVALCGPPGSGKSTLAAALAKHLGADACRVDHDDYDHGTRQSIAELQDWSTAGAAYEALPAPDLVRALSALRQGRGAENPNAGCAIAPAPVILFESHFGRAHRDTAPLIDFVIWLDTPLDIALARKLTDFLRSPGGPPPVGWLGDYLDNYQAVVGMLLRQQRERVRPGADLVLNGEADLDAQSQAALEAIAALRQD